MKILEPLEVLHIELCGILMVESINGKKYIHVIIGDFSHFTWVHFLRKKYELAQVMIKFIKTIEISMKKKV